MANISGSKWFQQSRINVNSDLSFDGDTQLATAGYLDGRYAVGTQNFAVSFFAELDTLTPETFFSLRNNNNSTLFELRAASTNQFQLFWQDTGGSLTSFTYSYDPISETGNKMHIIAQRVGTSLDVYVNSKKLTQLTGTTLPSSSSLFYFNGGGLHVASSTSDGINQLNTRISNLAIFNTDLSSTEINYIYTHGGIVPESLFEGCIAHYPFQSWCTTDPSIYSQDSVEQYNISKSDLSQSFGGFPPTYWGNLGFVGDGGVSGSTYLLSWGAAEISEKKISRNYRGSILKSVELQVVANSASVQGRIDIVKNSDSTVLQTLDVSLGFYTIDLSIGDETDYSVEIVGDHFQNDGNNQLFQLRAYNTDVDYLNNNIELRGFEDPGDTSTVIYVQTISDVSLPTGGQTSLSASTDRLAQTFQVSQEISNFDMELFLGSGAQDFDMQLQITGVVGDNSTGTPYTSEVIGTSNVVDAQGITDNEFTAFTFSSTPLKDGSTYAVILTPSNVTSLLGWGWERTPGTTDDYPLGRSWYSFNSGTSWINVSGLPKLDFAIRSQEIFSVGEVTFDQRNLKDFHGKETVIPQYFSTKYTDNKFQGYGGPLEANHYTTATPFTWIYYGTFAEDRFEYSGAGNLLYMWNSPLVDISLRSFSLWRLRLNGGVPSSIIDLTIPFSESPGVNVGKPYLHIIRYDPVSQNLNTIFHWYHNQKTFTGDASLTSFTSFGDNIIMNGSAPSSGGSNASPAILIAKDYTISDAEVESYKNRDFSDDSSLYFYMDFSVVDASGKVLDRGPNDYEFLRFDDRLPPAGNGFYYSEIDKTLFLESESLIPKMSQAFLTEYNSVQLEFPPSIFRPLDNSAFTMAFSTYPIRDIYPQVTTPLIRTNGGTNGNLWIYYNAGVSYLRHGIIGSPNVINQNTFQTYPLGTLTTSALFKDEGSWRTESGFTNFNFTSSPQIGLRSVPVLSGTSAADFSTVTDVTYNDDSYIARFSLYNKRLNEKELGGLNNNTLLKNSVFGNHKDLIAHYNFNRESFFATYNEVYVRNYADISQPNYSVPDFDGAWTLDSGFSVDASVYLTYDGTQPGTRSATANITNLTTNDNTRIKYSFDIISNTGTFWTFIGGSVPSADRIPITDSSGRVELIFDVVGSNKLFFANTNGASSDVTAVWTIANPVIEELSYDIRVTGLTGATPSDQLLDASTRLIDLCELQGSGGSDIPTNTDIWGDELDIPIVTENDDFIEVPPTP